MNRTGLIQITIAILAICMAGPSCSVLSRTQMDRIENLAVNADTVASAPSAIFSTLGEIRRERGLYYAATFTSPEVKFEEMDALALACMEDQKRSAKADIYVNILRSYFKALKSMSNPERWEGAGRELRGLGRGIDSLIIEHNRLFDTQIPEGIAKTTGKLAGYLAESVNKYRQSRFVKEFVSVGDTLVGECTDSLIAILKSDTMNELIAHESDQLRANYQAYLYAMSQGGYPPQMETDREYITLVEKMQSVKQIRNKSVSALRSVKNSHHKLLMELQVEDQDKNVYDDFQTLNRLAIEVCRLMEIL